MTFIERLPFFSLLDDDMLDCGLWQSDENVCELQGDEKDPCVITKQYFGTTDEFEPKFCPRHFFNATNGDGKSNYKLISEEQAKALK